MDCWAQSIRYAYQNELIERDITAGLTGFYGKVKRREILTPELAAALFSVTWRNERAYLANLLAMCTGLRSGEIRALRKKDIGKSCLYVNHSWSTRWIKGPEKRRSADSAAPIPCNNGKTFGACGK